MLQSKLFTRTQKQISQEETALNAQLLTRAGFVYKNSAGVYTYLPLGWRVIEKISEIIREEMDKIGGQEMRMPALIDKRYYAATGRGEIDVIFETKQKNSEQTGFFIGWTHEEILAEIATRYVKSYKDLPFAAYQIQTKFRNEPRAKSGLLRGREFIMKDLYSFHENEEDLWKYYDKAKKAYLAAFKRMGLDAIYTVAAGGDFTASNTHEFQVVSPVGEDTIYVCSKCRYAENNEISKMKAGGPCPKCGGTVEEKKSIEVGNIFPLGTKYSDPFNLYYSDKNGEKKLVIMGSYGIGVSRAMATIVEVHHDEKGMLWPGSVAPFEVHLLEINGGKGRKTYEDLQKKGIEVLYDERDASAGQKFADADLIGIPWRLVKSPATGAKVEVKRRDQKKTVVTSFPNALKLIQKSR